MGKKERVGDRKGKCCYAEEGCGQSQGGVAGEHQGRSVSLLFAKDPLLGS